MARKHGGSAVLEADGQGELDIDIPESALALEIQYIPWDLIFADPKQPRVEADADLKASIAAGGIRQPITVREKPGEIGTYEIIDGERRWRGAEGVQQKIPCVVRRDQDDTAERIRTQLVSNTAKPLSPVEEARAMHAIFQAGGGSVADLATHLGKAVSTVSQRLNLMALGPWLPMIEEGILKYTHAAEVLLPYRNCPDFVHEAVIEALGGLLGSDPDTNGETWHSADDFENHVVPHFKKHLHPITKKKGDEHPRFDVRAHDSECDCGGIELKEWDGKRRFCGNPVWWGPRKKTADKAWRAKVKPSKGSSSSATQRQGFYAPADAKRLATDGHSGPKGYVRLVNNNETFVCVDLRHAEDGFDPSDLPAEALPLAVGGSKSYPVLYVKEGKAIDTARAAWTARWEKRYKELLQSFKATLAKKRAITVKKDSAGDIVAALAPSADDAAGNGTLEDLLELHGLPINQWLAATERTNRGLSVRGDAGDRARDKAVLAWARKLDESKASALLVDLVTVITGQLVSASTQLHEEQLKVIEEIQRRKTPWAKPPKEAKGGKGKASAKADDEGEDE